MSPTLAPLQTLNVGGGRQTPIRIATSLRFRIKRHTFVGIKMAYGLEVYDGDGNLRLSLSDRITSLFTSISYSAFHTANADGIATINISVSAITDASKWLSVVRSNSGELIYAYSAVSTGNIRVMIRGTPNQSVLYTFKVYLFRW